MSDDPKSLPGLELGDIQFEQTGWKPNHGWVGLIPDVSTLNEIIAVLGQPTGQVSLANACCFDFFDGIIRVTFLEGDTTMFKVWVSSKLNRPSVMPENLERAISMFGPLKATRIEKNVGIIYERPGLRLACEDAIDPKPVKWIEFYQPR